jgi:hypothetical protein
MRFAVVTLAVGIFIQFVAVADDVAPQKVESNLLRLRQGQVSGPGLRDAHLE